MGGVPASAHAEQVVLDAPQVVKRVDVVHPGPSASPLVRHRVRHPVLLPPQPRHRVISLHPPPHVPSRVCGGSHMCIGGSQGVHDSSYRMRTKNQSYNNASCGGVELRCIEMRLEKSLLQVSLGMEVRIDGLLMTSSVEVCL